MTSTIDRMNLPRHEFQNKLSIQLIFVYVLNIRVSQMTTTQSRFTERWWHRTVKNSSVHCCLVIRHSYCYCAADATIYNRDYWKKPHTRSTLPGACGYAHFWMSASTPERNYKTISVVSISILNHFTIRQCFIMSSFYILQLIATSWTNHIGTLALMKHNKFQKSVNVCIYIYIYIYIYTIDACMCM